MVSMEDMGATFSGLRNLRLSLGVTALTEHEYYYEDNTIPTNIRFILSNRDSISLVNIFLILIFGSLITTIILKILTTTKYSENRLMDRAWKYCLGSYTFYGLLLLAYIEFSFLILNLRFF